MKKKLPAIFANKISKKLKNNLTIYYSKKDYKEELVYSSNKTKDVDLATKIEDIFNSPNYVYKMEVLIYTTDGKKRKKDIIGKIDDKLITIDEEYIPIDSIIDIEY